MGEVKRLLYSHPLATAAPAYYASKRSIELAESLHHHERNLRLEYRTGSAEFSEMCMSVGRAFRALQDRAQYELTMAPAETVYLNLSDIPAEPTQTPRRFDIEESTYPTLPETTIHIHYRNLRIELSHEEWREFAAGVIHAAAEFEASRE